MILWLAGVVGVQFMGYSGLALAGVLLLSAGAVTRWLAYVRRARWLLLSLWLILAYNTPGEAFRDLSWAPTYEGMAEANLQVTRLLAMLACLAWLFVHLGRDGMLSGLWGLLYPFRRLGMDVERLVVRLSLVLENLQVAPEKGAWRRMLADDRSVVDGPLILHVDFVPWSVRDTLAVIAACLGVMGAVWL